MSAPRVLCYVQHLMGIGHQRRMAAVARALVAAGARVTYVSGGYPVPGLDVGGAAFVQLPPARSPDMLYRSLVDEQGRPVDEAWRCRRRALLLETLSRARPDAVLVETFPFGRRLLRFELLPLLDEVRAAPRPPVVACSVRDIIENRPRPGRDEAVLALVERYFDRVLVHSDPGFVPFEATFPLAGRLGDRLRYTGYVAEGAPREPCGDQGSGEVIVSAGGGFFGQHVLRTALEARPLVRHANVRWRVLVGPHVPPESFEGLLAAAPPGIAVEANRPDFACLLANCAVSVSQGGYNTILDVLRSGARCVIVPYADEREREQATRARLLVARVPVQVVNDDELSPHRLAVAIDAAWQGPAPKGAAIDTAGAAATARLLLADVEARAGRLRDPRGGGR